MPAPEPSIDALSTEHLQADLKGRSVRGGVATVTAQGSRFVITMVSTVVLARLLTPSDFGLVAMVTAITGLGQAFADIGLSEATIQREDISHAQVSVLFWINLAVGVGLTAITVGLGPVLAWFYHQPRLIHIADVLSLVFVICGLRVQPDAILKRQMRFTALAIRNVVAASLAVALAILLALRGAGYWALVAFPLTESLAQVAISWSIVHWRPGLPRRCAEIGSLIRFGGNVAISYLIFTIINSIDKILVGRYWGSSELGLYSKAYKLILVPVVQLNAPIAGVAVPAFSRMQNDADRSARYYLRAVNLLAWVGSAIFGFLFVAAAPVIILALGRQWVEAVPVFRFFAPVGLGQILLESTVWFLVSRGEAGRLRNLLLIVAPILTASFVVGLPFGIRWVALSYTIALFAVLPWALKFTFSGTNLSLERLAKALVCPVSVALLGVAFGELALSMIAPRAILGQLLTVAGGFVVAYALSAAIRPVRIELVSLKGLLIDLRVMRQGI